MSWSTTTRSRRWLIVVAIVVVVAAAGVAVMFLLGGDEPDQVDAQRALQQEQEDGLPGLGELPSAPDLSEEPTEDPDDEAPDPPDEAEEPVADPAPGPPRELEDLDGRWVVDTSREFDRAEGRGTFAGYRIDEELANAGGSTAVGRSPEVSGEVVFDAGTVREASFMVDLTALVSDDGRRDARVRAQLGPDARARFELTAPIELPEVPPVGEVIELTAGGTLTLLATSREVEVALQAVVTDTGLLVAGSTDLVLSDYDVEVPSAPIVLSVSDQATLEWQLFLVRE